MEKTIKCKRCGKGFYSEYYEGGAIDHQNWTEDCKLESLFREGIDHMIKKLDMRVGNICNISNYNLYNQKIIINCTTIWLRQNGHFVEADEVTKYFEDKMILFNTIVGGDQEIKDMMYYVIEYNTIIDFYHDNDLVNKGYKFIKITNMDKKIDKKYFLGIEVDEQIYVLLGK